MALPSLSGAFNALKIKKNRDLACVGAGMGALMAGAKLPGLALFAKGMVGLEKEWRAKREFDGTWSERFEKAAVFYEGTHQDPTNRVLHRIGIPMILGGAAGLIVFPAYRPFWLTSHALFTVGWGLNLVGHGVYEKNKPAFADDPLSFLMGPLWDLQQARSGGAPEPAAPTAPEPVAVEQPLEPALA
ncbi:MAG: DUF962 domain-containing protein [Planctomycetes bacterium]|nr:DUF962 domain-containing protein [Planctomycetota bacterium]